MLVCTLGDLVLDVVVRLGTPLVRGGDVEARTVVAPGGQAANVAAWAAFLGASARFVGTRAADPAGSLAADGLLRVGVELAGPVVETGGTGVVVSLVAPDGDRTMASDRGLTPNLGAHELDPAWLADCDHLYVSGYYLASEQGRLAATRAVELAREAGAAVSVDLSAASSVESVGPAAYRELLAGLAPDVVFCNEDEDRAVGGPIRGALWILKRGSRGACFGADERAAAPTQVVDATGAGDALAAGWIVGGPELALVTAARCVAGVGAMPIV